MFKETFQRYLTMIEQTLAQLPWDKDSLNESMYYSLIGGGKRIRPVLALASAEAVGGNPEAVLQAAASIELIHTYSLIHDDLPAMDNDDYRRGRLSNHKVFGEAQAILAGDALLTYAFEILANLELGQPERELRVIREVAVAAGKDGMVGGQVADVAGEGKALSLNEIEEIHKAKTGAILTVSARLGGILSGGTEEQIEALTDYAQALGLAFQIKDDILDIVGDSETLGKPAGSDIRQGKSTYVSLLGLDGAGHQLHAQILKAQAAIKPLGERASFLNELAFYIEERKH
ncbi:polyprenyl synthetase family protein [Desulfosporosinus nitroreducens]|uniref:Polyprenyl synthetase family protein n=1 Tax=Desulfosporosinus nitroreducens TaxID=2018668 RepID=A0ABT8QQ12_9FIRM|nr:farnesyl diphosphate synthase [Desulfosporosinus nitroreducens]MCO1600038.1 polyprenyl synthetase family protein [Desulfosporosinus nitroreducens]MDO0822932.1 polyprenyl synthetase family protein [Desulfosporosinus nitroreducens]